MEWLKIGFILFVLVGLADMSIASPPQRPALGLHLGGMTMTDTAIWLARHGLDCHREQDRMTCFGLTPAQIGINEAPPIDELLVTFSPQGRLNSVEIFRQKVSAAEASAILHSSQKILSQKLGPPTRHIEGRLLEYRFDDYVARIATAKLSSGVAISEVYSARLGAIKNLRSPALRSLAMGQPEKSKR